MKIIIQHRFGGGAHGIATINGDVVLSYDSNNLYLTFHFNENAGHPPDLDGQNIEVGRIAWGVSKCLTGKKIIWNQNGIDLVPRPPPPPEWVEFFIPASAFE